MTENQPSTITPVPAPRAINADYYLYFAWTVSLVAMLGSLYFSNILNLPPCVLCWYQRICMYPLVAILTVGIIRKDSRVALYALPLSVIGILINIYHNLLYYHIIPESIAPCTNGVSCTTRFVQLGHVFTIPLLALIGFALINVFLIIHLKLTKRI